MVPARGVDSYEPLLSAGAHVDLRLSHANGTLFQGFIGLRNMGGKKTKPAKEYSGMRSRIRNHHYQPVPK